VLRAVLDANVYVSAAIRPEGPPGQLLEALVSQSAFELVMSPAIIDEVTETLKDPKVRRYIKAQIDAPTWFETIAVLADVVLGDRETSAVSRDPEDDKYLAAAVEGLATFVVTGDSDLLDLREHGGVRIVTPRQFLDILEDDRAVNNP
jgi:putative PIN family toxin of toxin-antitoxin system